MELAEALQLMALKTMEGSKPAEPFIGEVMGISPLVINVNNKLPVNRNRLVLAKGLDLEVGDRVLCIRALGGQKYYVICEVEKDGTA